MKLTKAQLRSLIAEAMVPNRTPDPELASILTELKSIMDRLDEIAFRNGTDPQVNAAIHAMYRGYLDLRKIVNFKKEV